MALRTLPPAGTPIRGRELLRWGTDGLLRREARGAPGLEREFERRFEVSHAMVLSSGRALLSIALSELARRHPDRTEVVVPAYTCYSVAAAVARAGLRVRPVEIDAATLDYAPDALEELETGPVLAMVSASLFGIPDALPRLEAFARRHSIALIDDAAQAMGARVGSRPVGTFGTAGLFSLDKGKNITSLRGGVLLTDDDGLAGAVRERIQTVPSPTLNSGLKDIAGLTGYGLLLHPRPYWLLDRILDLGRTTFDPDFEIRRYPDLLAPMALQLLDRLDEVNDARRRCAHAIRERLRGLSGVTLPGAQNESAVFLRMPVLFDDPATRDRALRRLAAAGLGATGYYPRALPDVPDVHPHLAGEVAEVPVARRVASCLVTLPTHALVTAADVDRMAGIVAEVSDLMHTCCEDAPFSR